MADRAQVKALAARLRAGFEARGAQAVETPVLQPAGTLLDLYGEDIRARAYVTSDALRGEQMLRPDFTVPVVQMHMQGGAEPARYTYAGEVFRRQEHDPARASEYLQVGYEIFDRADPAGAEAEVFAALAAPLAGLPVHPRTGDIGLILAAVEGLETSPARKAALLRHVWRPGRFLRLLERFSGRAPRGPLAPPADDAPEIGKRRRAEVEARRAALIADAAEPPIDAAPIEALLAVEGPLPVALERLQGLAARLPAIVPAVARLEARAAALEVQGVKVAELPFSVSFGRTTMEYYDGFVFAFSGPEGLPPVATGGRYDALTLRLGQGRDIPAVGGVLRPGVMADLEAGEEA